MPPRPSAEGSRARRSPGSAPAGDQALKQKPGVSAVAGGSPGRQPGARPAHHRSAPGQGPADGRRQTDRGRTARANQRRAGPPLLPVPRPSGRSASPTAAAPARSRHPAGGAHLAAASGPVRPGTTALPRGPGQQPAAPVARTPGTHRAAAAPHGAAAATSACAPPARPRTTARSRPSVSGRFLTAASGPETRGGKLPAAPGPRPGPTGAGKPREPAVRTRPAAAAAG